MNAQAKKAVGKVDIRGWKTISLEFGAEFLEISVPPETVSLSMRETAVLPDPAEALEKALSSPIGCPPLETMLRKKGKRVSELTAAVAVSDITRPVPYKGDKGLLPPLLRRLEDSGIPRGNITILVGTGMHRPSAPDEKLEMFGEPVIRSYRILDHDCQDPGRLTHIGTTRKGTEVRVNADFFSADVKIVTGLVESHFMAGVSGGRKAVCPALVDKRTIEKFHGPEFLESPRADNLILEGNPCHEEALEVAAAARVDFSVNVTLDRNMRPTEVFAGHLVDAHAHAFRFMKGYTAIPIDREYDIVLTHGGYAGRNHYQTAKAACGALPAVKPGGTIIVAADNHDPEPVGGPEYRDLLRRLKRLGIEGYLDLIMSPDWTFTKDQWEPQVWGRVLKKVGEEGLVYCSPQIRREDHGLLPGRSGFDYLEGEGIPNVKDSARAMVQNALMDTVSRHLEDGRTPSLAVLREGPYGIPVLRTQRP